jgi:ribose transport system permease protein
MPTFSEIIKKFKPAAREKHSSFSKVSVATKKAILSGCIFVFLFIFFSIMAPDTFPKMTNLINLSQQVVTYAIIGFGLTFCLICGGTDLSAGASGALCGMVMLLMLSIGLPLWLGLIACLVIGLITGIINGFSIEILGVVPFIATLGTQWVYRGMANVFTNGNPVYTRDTITDPIIRDLFYKFGGGRISDTFPGFPIPLPWSVIVMIFYGIILAVVLAKTKIGRQVYACGSNLEAAKLSGINAVGTRMFAYCVSGLSAAVCGILVTSRLNSAQPVALTGIEMEAIAAAVLGGVSNNGGEGTIINAFIGAVAIGTLRNGLTLIRVSTFWQTIIVGVILVAACAADAYRHRRTA